MLTLEPSGVRLWDLESSTPGLESQLYYSVTK